MLDGDTHDETSAHCKRRAFSATLRTSSNGTRLVSTLLSCPRPNQPPFGFYSRRNTQNITKVERRLSLMSNVLAIAPGGDADSLSKEIGEMLNGGESGARRDGLE